MLPPAVVALLSLIASAGRAVVASPVAEPVVAVPVVVPAVVPVSVVAVLLSPHEAKVIRLVASSGRRERFI